MKTLEDRTIERGFAAQMAGVDPKWLRRELRSLLDDLIDCREWRVLAEVMRVMVDAGKRENRKLLSERARKIPLTNLLRATVSPRGSGSTGPRASRRPRP